MNITINLDHSFLLTCHDLNFLLNDCQKLSTFCEKLDTQSKKYPDRYDPLKYKGDGFELFVEALIKLSPVDNRIGIYDYQNAQADEPGVDGFGLGSNGKPATVQCKFVNWHEKLLTGNADGSNLMGFAYLSQNKFGVDIADVNNMLIMTTAAGLHYYTGGTMMMGKVRCLGYKDLQNIVDDNLAFWNLFRELIK